MSNNEPGNTTKRTLTLDFGRGAYPIHIGAGILGQDLLSAHLRSSQALIVSNEIVAPLYLERLLDALPAKVRADQFLLPDSEAAKSLENFSSPT